jgi:acyl-CoA thioester hydrolase
VRLSAPDHRAAAFLFIVRLAKTAMPHRLGLRVYYEDTDFSGLVYHASYLRFMERGRTEFLRDFGIDQRALFLGELALGFAVRHMAISFDRPAMMDDLLTIETQLVKLHGASLDIEQKVLRAEELLVTATVKIACLSAGRAQRLPMHLRRRFEDGAR